MPSQSFIWQHGPGARCAQQIDRGPGGGGRVFPRATLRPFYSRRSEGGGIDIVQESDDFPEPPQESLQRQEGQRLIFLPGHTWVTGGPEMSWTTFLGMLC
jgi:hypothetical protein